MKRILKISAIVILAVLAVILAFPFLFKDQIMKKIKEEVNKSVYAKVEWNSVSVSLLTGFPDLKVSLKDVSVVGINAFEGDTLVGFDEFALKVDLLSIVSGKINVKSVLLDNPLVNAITLADGSVNYDIAIPDTVTIPEETETDTSSMSFSVKLKKFEIRDARIHYTDIPGNMSASLEDFDFLLSGDMSMDLTDLDITTSVGSLDFTMDGVPYLKNSTLGFVSLIKADLVKYLFTFGETEFRLNDISLGFEGSFGMPDDVNMDIDVKFFTKETSFKSLLSMVPAMYSKDFEGLVASGMLTLEGDVKGVVNDTLLPVINLALAVDNGHFAYPDLPKSVDKVEIDVKVLYDGTSEDNTRVDINKFHLEIAGNPFDMQLHLLTPMSDMQMSGLFKGIIDLGSLADVVPLDGMSLSGTVRSDLSFMGKMSDIENENYEAFQADGSLEISNLNVSTQDLPVPVTISRTSLLFSPRFVSLATFDAVLGNSDIHMEGKLENFIPYVFKNETIKGNLNFTGQLIDLNELMADSTAEEEVVTEDSSALSVIEVPANIDFVLQTNLTKVLYDQMEISNILGVLIVRDGTVKMEKLAMNLLEGSMVLNGEYNTKDISRPSVNMNMSIKTIDIPSAFSAFNTVQKLAPAAKNMKGKISTDLQFSSLLDSAMSPVYNSILGKGVLMTNQVEISNSETFNRIADVLKNEKFRNVVVQDVNASFEIMNGRVYVKPFDTKLGPARTTIGGDQGLDQTMNYTMAMSVPRSEFGGAANEVYNGLISQASSKGFDLKASENVNLQLLITGTFSDPKIGLDVKESMAESKAQVKEVVTAKVKEEVAKVKEDVKAEAEKILKDAEKQANAIKAEAKAAGDKLISEAKTNGDKLVKEAGSNPVKKAAAQKTSATMVKKAEDNAANLNKEADAKANAILEAARKKANSL